LANQQRLGGHAIRVVRSRKSPFDIACFQSAFGGKEAAGAAFDDGRGRSGGGRAFDVFEAATVEEVIDRLG
jgi:hypothetical protein